MRSVCTRATLYISGAGDDDASTVMSGGSNDSKIRDARLADARDRLKVRLLLLHSLVPH